MRCPECGTDTGGEVSADAARCLDCGTLLSYSRKGQSQASKRHSYNTSYGKFIAQVQTAGTWAGAYQFSVEKAQRERLATLVGNLGGSLQGSTHPALSRFHSFDATHLRCFWTLQHSNAFEPLSSQRLPLPPKAVRHLVELLGGPLQRLHESGLGAFDLAPQMIFVEPNAKALTLAPTPWLASLVRWNPGHVGGMPFVAPELDDMATRPDPARADVYALGALCWHLLTGKQRRDDPQMLPSEVSPQLFEWDAFIDGCCRTNPERRFASVSAALDALPLAASDNRESVTATGGSPPSLGRVSMPQPESSTNAGANRQRERRTTRSQSTVHRRGKYLMIGVVVLVLAGLYLRREQIASMFPATAGLLMSYERGFGDTILKYEDRSYEGSKWERLQEADSLIAIASVQDLYSPEFRSVVGWDDESFWILCDGSTNAAVFHNSGGHWTCLGIKDDLEYPIARPANKDVLYAVGSYSDEPPLYRINGTTWTICGKLGGDEYRPELCVIAHDLVYCLGRYDLEKYEASTVTKMPTDKYKEGFVHRPDNTPLKEYPVKKTRLTKVSGEGTAWGVVRHEWKWYEWKLVRFQNGIWYEVEDVGDIDWSNASWLGTSSSNPQFFVFVGDGGQVLLHEIGSVQQEHSIALAQEYTSGDLVAVWGVSPEKYWVMDKNGTVWERFDNRWRTVVRGMYRDDIEFVDAWVSPTGTVIAVTEDAVYRLE